MADEIIEELWRIKDSLALESGYDLDTLIAHLAERRSKSNRPVVDLSARKKPGEQDHATAQSP